MNSNDRIHDLFDYESFITDIVLALRDLDMSIIEFCKKAGISRPGWDAIRKGHNRPAFQTVLLLADYFKLSLDAYRYNYRAVQQP